MKKFNFFANLLRSEFAMSGMMAGNVTPDDQPTVSRQSRLMSVQWHYSANTARATQKWLKYAAMFVMLFTIGIGNAWGETVSVSISTYASANSWTNGTAYSSVAIDANVSATGLTNGNNSKYYSSNSSWRHYEGDEGTITIATTSGTLSSITFTYANGNNGVIKYNSANKTSGTAISVSGSSVSFTVGHSSGTKNGNVQITAISVTYTPSGGGSTPSLTADPTSLAWGTVLQGSSQSDKTISISGSNLTAGSLTIAASGGYSVTPTSKSVSGTLSATTLTVTPPSTSTTGAKNGKVTISGGGLASNVEVDLTMTVNAAYTVNWYVGGTQVKTELVASGATATLPPTPADNALGGSCSSLKFVGWSETNIGSTPTTAPADLFTAAPTISAAKNYYAVFAESTIAFEDDMNISGTSGVDSRSGWSSFSKANGGDGSIRLSTGSYAGVMTTNALSSLTSSATQISFEIAAWSGSENGKVTLSASKGTIATTAFTATSTSFTSVSTTITGADATTQLTFTGASGYRIYIRNIVVGSASNYVTSCCSLKPVTSLAVTSTTGTSVTLGWTAPSPTTGIDHLELRNASTDAKIGSDISKDATTVTVSGLTECATYSYKIVSVGSCEVASSTINAQPYSGAKTVTYNYHEGTGSPASFTTACGSTSTNLPTPTRANYRFDGWYTQASGGTHIGDGGDSYTPTADITLHAQWTRVYTVTYAYGTGGSGSCSNGSFAAGATVTTCGSATRTGSTLSKWVRSDNSAEITPGGTFTMPSSNVTLTAKWSDTEYTLTQTVGLHITKGHTGTIIKSGMTEPSGLSLTYSISDGSYALPKTVSLSGGGKASWTLTTDYTWTVSADKHSATLLIKPTTISGNLTITVTEQARYTVVWDRPGTSNDETEYYAADDNSVTMKTGEDDCGTKKFYCWTETPGSLSPTPTAASSGTISGNKTYTAVYGDRSGGEGFEKVTSIQNGATYYIATGLTSSDQGYGGRNGSNDFGTNIALSGATFNGSSVLTAFPSSVKAVTVAVSGNYFSMYDGSNYLTLTSDGNYINYSNSAAYVWELTANNYYIKPKDYSRWIMFNSNRFACYSNAQDKSYAYLYKPAVSWSNFSTSCELYDISITTPSGGTVSTSPTAGEDAAGAGQTITVTATPGSCKYLSALKYNDGSDHTISIASTPYTFTMPSADVTVTATFSDKTVSSIAPNTSTHRTLMQSTSFVGEQIRVTFNNGETEDLAWNDSKLAFSGYNMSTLGAQTVTVAYTGCGTTTTTYSITIVDGVPVTFWDAGEATVNKYNVGQNVPVETTVGRYNSTCSGWVFAGWSETKIDDNSTTFTPVYNFNASTPKTLYAVYSKEGSTWLSALNVSEMRSGAKYVIVKNYSSGNQYALTNAVDASATNYLDGSLLSTDVETVKDASNNNRYKLKVVPTASMIWIVKKKDTKWVIYSPNAGKYLKLTSDGYTQITTSCEDEFTLTDGYNDSEIDAESTNATGKHLAWYNSSPKYWNAYGSAASNVYWITNNEQFSSTPPCGPRSVTFHGNGGIVTNYEETESDYDLVVTEASRDAGITTPTADMDASDCAGNDWTFMGWLDEEVDVSRVPILTTDLLNDGGGGKAHTITADDEEYWAVYSNTGPAETKYGTISFTKSNFAKSYYTSEQTTTMTVATMGDYDFGYKNIGHSSEIGIQFEEDNGELYNKTSLGKVNSISFTTFSSGDINKLKVYVGDEEKTTDHQLTAAEMQNVGSTWTYYPTENESYVYITNVGKGNGSHVCVGNIDIDFGKGTTIYATTPVCSTIRLSGDVYVTSRNGVGIMAATPLSVEAHQLDGDASVVITSNSSDVYFSTDRNPNFSKASKPATSVTVTATDGELSATPIYVHYKPSSDGTGAATNVTVYANLSPADPNIKGEKTIHVRNLPEKVVIAAKVGGAYYALPANLNGATNPAAVLIDVDESNMTAIGPASCAYTIWPVKTTFGSGDRYALQGGNAYGERVRFSATNNSNKGLWANNASSDPKTRIDNNAAITAIGSDPAAAYEWKITTTVTDGKWSHTLQTDQTNNTKYLRYWTAATGGPKWGTYDNGEINLYLLPVTQILDAEMTVMEWGTNSMTVKYDNAGTVASGTFKAKIGSGDKTSVTCTPLGGDIYQLTGVGDLQSNPATALTLSMTETTTPKHVVLTIPLIVTAEKTEAQLCSYAAGGNGSTLITEGRTIARNLDVIIRNGGKLTTGTAEGRFKDLYIYPGGKAKITNNLAAANVYMRGGYSFLDNKATYRYPDLCVVSGTVTTNGVKYDLYVDNRYYYTFSMPYDVTLASVTDEAGNDNFPVWVKHYNGATRASGEHVSGWEWYGDNAVTQHSFFAGRGYEITAKPAVSGRPIAIIRFPVKSGNITTDAAHAVGVSVGNYGYDDYEDGSLAANNVGWNLVGNPYFTEYKAGSASGEGDTLMIIAKGFEKNIDESTNVWDGTYKWTDANTARFITVPYDTRTDYHAEYVHDYTIPAFSAFFIQTEDEGTFYMRGTRTQAAAAPRFGTATKAKPELHVDVLLSGEGEVVDGKAGLFIHDKYEGGLKDFEDVEQWFVEQNELKTYTFADGVALSYNLTNEQAAKQTVPMGYIATVAGEHTYSINEANDVSALEHLWLTDNETGITTDLLARDYVFTTAAGRFDERFALSAVFKQEEVITDVGDVGDSDWTHAIGVYHEGNTLTLRGLPENSAVYIYDMTGKLTASSDRLHNAASFSIAAQGVYNIRVVNGNSAVTLRSVLR